MFAGAASLTLGARIGLAAGLLLSVLAGGCESSVEVELRRENRELGKLMRKKDNEILAQQATIAEQRKQIDRLRGLSDHDLEKIFYPEKIVIDKLSGGADYDSQPGDDGVTVYLKPIDRYGDVVKVAGDVRIQLYDLEAPSGQKLIGEYVVPVDQVGELWHGKLMTGHFTIKCPWPGTPPKHTEITIRVTFVDYFTGRVISAQEVCVVTVAPQ